MKPIRVVLADDHPIVLMGLAGLLAGDAAITVVATCRNGKEALDAVRRQDPDIAVLDVRMPAMTGTEVLAAIKSGRHRARVILLTASASEVEILSAIAGGASAVVRKDMASDDLLRCLHIVAGGGRWFPRDTDGRGAELSEPAVTPGLSALTPREREVALLVAAGASNKGIAGRIGLTEGTVKLHLHNIYRKLGISNRTELATLAIAGRAQSDPDG